MNEKLKIIYIFLKTVISTVLSALLTSYYNVANLFSFIPEKNKFAVSNGIYLAFVLLVFSFLEYILNKKKLEIDLFFSVDKYKKGENEDQTAYINSKSDTAKFFMDLTINGIEEKLNKEKIIIYFSPVISIQSHVKNGRCISIDTEKNIIILDLSQITNSYNTENIKSNFKFQFDIIKNSEDIPSDTYLTVDKRKKNLLIKTNTNKLKVAIKEQ